MTIKARSLFVIGFLVLATPTLARAQSATPNLGYYGTPANVSAFVPFVDGAATVTQKAILATSLSALGITKDLRFTMDTGSTGIAISADKFNPDPGGQHSEKGYIKYGSSDLTERGYLTTTKVDFKDGPGNVVASAEVKVLVVLETCDKVGACKEAKDVSYFGVGFDRSGIQAGTPEHSHSVPDANPFLNLKSINGVSPDEFAKLRPGYIITNSALHDVRQPPGVTLGITSAVNTDNYAFTKLTPNTQQNPHPAGCPSCDAWNPLLATVTTGNGTITATASKVPLLPDSGVDHMLLSPPEGSGLALGPAAPVGTTVQIQLPGQTGAAISASYNFTVTDPVSPTNPLTPARVQIDKGQPNVNTGITFFTGFDYLYDAVGGFVGYRSNGNVPAYAWSTPILSLVGDVLLPTGFSTDYLTNLAGDTFLKPTDTATFQSAISGTGRLAIANGTVLLQAANTYSGGTNIASGATLQMGTGSSLLASGAMDVGGTFDLMNSNQTIGALSGGGSILLGNGTLTAGGATDTTFSGVMSGSGGFVKQGAGILTLTGANTYAGGTTVQAGTLQGTTKSLQGNIVTNAMLSFSQPFDGTYAGNISGTGALTKSGTGFVTLSGVNSYSGGTFVQQGVLQGTTASLQGNIINNALVAFEQNTAGTYAGNMSGTGSVSKRGPGTVTFSGANSYAGGTTVLDGILKGTTNSLQGNIVNGGQIVFDQGFDGTYSGGISGSGSVTLQGTGLVSFTGINSFTGGLNMSGGATLQGNTNSLVGNINIGANSTVVFNQTGYGTFSGILSGDGGISLTGGGAVNLTGNNTYSGPTMVSNGLLAVNGSITSNVTVGPGGSLGGNGLILGNVSSGGTLSPGNSIGTLNIAGNLNQTPGGIYQVELNNQGQSDRVNVTGTATLGGTVTFLANPGPYAASQSYTILNAAGGLTGTYAGAMGNYAFLFPSLSYDASNIYLTITRSFARGAQTPNQAAVGAVFDANAVTATGDFAGAISALTTLSPAAGTAALNALSGQNYSGFSSVGVQSAQLFMSNFTGQIGGSSGGSNRVALAEACEVACDASAPALWGAWGGAVGGLGIVGGNANAGTLTYNLGGFAGGLDRRITPEFLLGVTIGYNSGTQWVQGFQGQGTTSTVQAGLYGSFTRGPLYLDGLAAYAYSNNQMTRQIAIPGFGGSTARGQTGANQIFGQIETGYRLDVGGSAATYVIPFARLQAATATQNAFTETGAGSLGLSVAAQTTNSLRTVFGALLGGAMDLGWREKLAMQFRLGWGHEFADTARPVTASFIGAPTTPFTTYGAAPLRDSVVLGLAANTTIAEATSAYLRYEGDVSYQNANHALTAGVRMTW